MLKQQRYQVGQIIGQKYRVHRVVEGGMGEVYLCTKLDSKLPYALKTFRKQIESLETLKALEYEVSIWIKIGKHPNIVRCHWMEVLNNIPFIVLEWIESDVNHRVSLRDWLRNGNLPIAQSIEFASDICQGLIYAEQQHAKIVHQDLKPDNILVDQLHTAKITDFGLASVPLSVIQSSTDPQEPSFRGGTAQYMAPEQWNQKGVDQRTDIYAIGCILYECLTGHYPFPQPEQVKNREAFFSMWKRNHLDLDPNPLPNIYPAEIGQLIKRCLEKQMDSRYPNIKLLVEGLGEIYKDLFKSNLRVIPVTNELTAIDYYNRGSTYERLKMWESAIDAFDEAIKLDSMLTDAYSNRGNVYHNLKQYSKALDDYNHALMLEPKHVLTFSNRGFTYVDLGQTEDALDDWNKAIDLDPSFAAPYANRGIIFSQQKRYEAAITDFDKAISLDPYEYKYYMNRGIARFHATRSEEALEDLDKSLELEQRDSTIYLNRALIYNSRQDYTHALSDLQKAIELDKNNPDFFIVRGRIHYELKSYSYALEDLTNAVLIDHSRVDAYLFRGLTYISVGVLTEAIADLNMVIALDPELGTAFTNRGEVYRQMGDYHKALSDLNRAIDPDNNAAAAYHSRALVYSVLEQASLELADFNEAIRLDPSNAIYYYNRGNTYKDMHRFDEAIADYMQAIKIQPEYGRPYHNLGVIFYELGRIDDSLEHFERAGQLGYFQSIQVADQIRQSIGSPPSEFTTLKAFKALEETDSLDKLRMLVIEYPFIVDNNFIKHIDEVIKSNINIPLTFRRRYVERIDWLRQLNGSLLTWG